MTTLAEHDIVAGAENHPSMLEKSMYDSWASRIRLFIKGKKQGRVMLDSIDNCPLVYLTVEDNGKTKPKKYSELTEAQQLQDDCDVQAKISFFAQGKDLIECINKEMEFFSAVASRFPPSNNHLKTLSNPRNQATIQDGRVTVQQVQGRQHQSYAGTVNKGFATSSKGNEKLMLAEAKEAAQILDEEQLAFLADPAKAVLMENLSSCDLEVLSEVSYSKSYSTDMINQDVQEM
nr:hypothetical protein [Tanacetum cinerariifolium]